MTREQYINMRNNGDFMIVYEYYKEHFDNTKHSPFFSPQELVQILPMRFNVQLIYEKCVKHFDDKFQIVTIKDKEGNTIKMS